jgi:hypothetical protein
MGPADLPWQPQIFQSAPDPAKDKGQDSAPRPKDVWSQRPRTVEARGGIGGPFGYTGVSFEWAPVYWFATAAGVGYLPGGPQVGLVPRLRLPITTFIAVGMGVPFSAGPYVYAESVPMPADVCGGGDCRYRLTRTWEVAYWGHLEPSVDFRLASGLQVRLYGGYSRILNGTDAKCEANFNGGCLTHAGERKTYGGVALGYAF